MIEAAKQKKRRGRPSSFNKEDVLETVMGLFWERGYYNVSINEISQETGLTRTSLYNSFKTKEALFIEALNQYFDCAPDHTLNHVKDGDCVGDALHAMLKNAAKMYSSDPKGRGCMSANCMSELMSGEGIVQDHVSKIYEDYKTRLSSLIEQAVRQSELPEDTDPQMTAHMVLTFMNGFSTFSKSNVSEKELENLGNAFLIRLGFDFSSHQDFSMIS